MSIGNFERASQKFRGEGWMESVCVWPTNRYQHYRKVDGEKLDVQWPDKGIAKRYWSLPERPRPLARGKLLISYHRAEL